MFLFGIKMKKVEIILLEKEEEYRDLYIVEFANQEILLGDIPVLFDVKSFDHIFYEPGKQEGEYIFSKRRAKRMLFIKSLLSGEIKREIMFQPERGTLYRARLSRCFGVAISFIQKIGQCRNVIKFVHIFMVDIYSKKKRSEIMSLVRAKETEIEIRFRKELWKLGFRYRKNTRKYFGTPDIVLKKYETVIFIDSCFWHGCKKHGTLPKTRKCFWKNKIKRNIERDWEVSNYYKKSGWHIIRIWEHEIKKDFGSIFNKTITKIN